MSELFLWKYKPGSEAPPVAQEEPHYVLSTEEDLPSVERDLSIAVERPGVSFDQGLRPLWNAGINVNHPRFYIDAAHTKQ